MTRGCSLHCAKARAPSRSMRSSSVSCASRRKGSSQLKVARSCSPYLSCDMLRYLHSALYDGRHWPPPALAVAVPSILKPSLPAGGGLLSNSRPQFFLLTARTHVDEFLQLGGILFDQHDRDAGFFDAFDAVKHGPHK